MPKADIVSVVSGEWRWAWSEKTVKKLRRVLLIFKFLVLFFEHLQSFEAMLFPLLVDRQIRAWPILPVDFALVF